MGALAPDEFVLIVIDQQTIEMVLKLLGNSGLQVLSSSKSMIHLVTRKFASSNDEQINDQINCQIYSNLLGTNIQADDLRLEEMGGCPIVIAKVDGNDFPVWLDLYNDLNGGSAC